MWATNIGESISLEATVAKRCQDSEVPLSSSRCLFVNVHSAGSRINTEFDFDWLRTDGSFGFSDANLIIAMVVPLVAAVANALATPKQIHAIPAFDWRLTAVSLPVVCTTAHSPIAFFLRGGVR